jgi:hypothetical protein
MGAEWWPAALLASSSWEGAQEKDGIAVLVSWRRQEIGSRGRDEGEGARSAAARRGWPACCRSVRVGGSLSLAPHGGTGS